MPSVRDQPGVIDDYLAEECSRWRVLGPLRLEFFPQVHPNRFAKGMSEKWRLIVDMSFPIEAAVNDGIDESLCSLLYAGVGDEVKGIVVRGCGTQLAKVDIKSAYRKVPVHPDDCWLTGVVWRIHYLWMRHYPLASAQPLRSSRRLQTQLSGWCGGKEWSSSSITWMISC